MDAEVRTQTAYLDPDQERLENQRVIRCIANEYAEEALSDLFERNRILTWNELQSPKAISRTWHEIESYYQKTMEDNENFREVIRDLKLAKLRATTIAEACKDIITSKERLICIKTVVLIRTEALLENHRWIEVKI